MDSSALPLLPHLLIVDDHSEIRDLLKRFLSQHNYRVSLAADGDEMEQCLRDNTIDLIVLDLMLPGKDGLTLCRELRVHSNIPVIMLTAMGEEVDKIIGLEMGADDYLPKPFNPRELLARIKAVIRRFNAIPEGKSVLKSKADSVEEVQDKESHVYRFNRWCFDIGQRELTDNDGIAVSLTSAEFTLLKVFVEHPRKVLSREQLLDLAKGRETDVYDRSIDTIISRLRKKLEIDHKKPELIKTIWGGGYQMVCEVKHD
ncbi:response regulator [Photobacterium profundum]|uniref:response regulator n=1 Tax=Photobacterium profundum TaxID=74109 RepID=UPI003D0F8921